MALGHGEPRNLFCMMIHSTFRILILAAIFLAPSALRAQYTVTGCETVAGGTNTILDAHFLVTSTGNFINAGTVQFDGVTLLTNNGGMSEGTNGGCTADYRNPCSNTPGTSGVNLFSNAVGSTTINGSNPVRMYAATIDRNIQLANEWQIIQAFTFMSGMVSTNRANPGYFLHLRAGGSVSGNSDSRHVDGYAAWSGTGAFTLPIGNGAKQMPVGVVGDCGSVFKAAYFSTDPDVAALPSGAPFNTTALGTGVGAVSQVEYWDIDGATSTSITLHFDAASNLGAIVSEMAQVVVAGWNGAQWVSLGQAGSTGTLAGGGTITSLPVIPDEYAAFTFGFQTTGRFLVKARLQGAMFGVVSGSLMRDDLRIGGYLPATEPFTLSGGRLAMINGNSGAAIGPGVLDVTGNNAIVDWVLVEFRSAVDPTVIVATRAALLQRDGDIVSPADGSSGVEFGIPGESYYVSVRHRNHLGIMTAAPVTITLAGAMVDFIEALDGDVYHRPGYAGLARTTAGGGRVLWGGDANEDGKLKYTGFGNDLTAFFAQVLSFSGNGLLVLNFNNMFGYYGGDVNMDGQVKYTGLNTDASWVFINVLGYALNSATALNYNDLLEQLP